MEIGSRHHCHRHYPFIGFMLPRNISLPRWVELIYVVGLALAGVLFAIALGGFLLLVLMAAFT